MIAERRRYYQHFVFMRNYAFHSWKVLALRQKKAAMCTFVVHGGQFLVVSIYVNQLILGVAKFQIGHGRQLVQAVAGFHAFDDVVALVFRA